MEESETLDDLEHNEDGRGCCYQPLLKTDPEAADRSPSRIAKVLRDLMRGGQQELRTGIASHFSPGLAALPHFQTMGVSETESSERTPSTEICMLL
jgi:hypothetical protein